MRSITYYKCLFFIHIYEEQKLLSLIENHIYEEQNLLSLIENHLVLLPCRCHVSFSKTNLLMQWPLKNTFVNNHV